MVDLSQKSYWRKRLFDAGLYELFIIDRDHLEGVPLPLAGVIRARNLKFEVSKVDLAQAPEWMRADALVIFRFRAVEFPSLVTYSANNPGVV